MNTNERTIAAGVEVFPGSIDWEYCVYSADGNYLEGSRKEIAAYIQTAVNSYSDLLAALQDAVSRLEEWIGVDCECDNTHTANGTRCCLCQYRAAIARASGKGGA